MSFFQKLTFFLGVLTIPYLLGMSGLFFGHSPPILNGAGGSFPYPLYSKWYFEYTKIDPSVRFNYQPIGSGGGIHQLLSHTIDFAGSDSPIPDTLLTGSSSEVIHIPTVAGAVVIAYNVANIPLLNLNKETISGIFLGEITRWNDPRIVSLNPQATLPDLPIVVIHRSDGSGTTYIFTEYLSKISQRWATLAGKGTSVRWQIGIGAKGNAGVAAAIKTIHGAIGYIELAYALQNDFSMAAIQNQTGQYVAPSMDSVTKAFPRSFDHKDFRISLTDSAEEGAYPIAGLTWILLNINSTPPLRLECLIKFLSWALTDGQTYALPMDYAPLPSSLRQNVLNLLEEVKRKNSLSVFPWSQRGAYWLLLGKECKMSCPNLAIFKNK
ncbi:phosphate ABC transporter substrate-binding protein [Methylacidiphilum kamchatkense Kam1]|uniref:Phosphate-binding protein n=1 Tax=Methylacidiphilum kamchatkense Kam1 TaxID=1202785 RepID=A0A0C1V5R6_9BACT|nr:phosphate ABC transporter substrate-binding protein PstS [Methylacidiphilum kamchatkense]KIE59085.1 phosphate ABC transporter substrate-binding protein [Methylacidiphilum kamchatkense Kam1]QDQ43002.1 phosphate ABC transporter substrate-binding protein (PhoT family) [Methylacidiphilum kamchatkense Kam1]